MKKNLMEWENEVTTGERRIVASGPSGVNGEVDEGGVEDAEGPVRGTR